MTDIAELGLAVRSDGVVVAKDRLKGMTSQANLADRAVANLIGTVGKLVAAFSVWQIGSALVNKFVDSTIEAEKVQTQLANVLRSTGNVAGYTLGQLNAMSKGFQQVTAYGDEAIGSAQALLLTFTRIGGEVFPDALEAILDVSTAMGGDLNSATLQVGKALNDPIAGLSALSRVGIQFSQDQKTLIKGFVDTGQVAKAQAVIIEELGVQFGNSARAARGTLGGALTALGEAFGDLFEANGPEADRLRKSVEDLIAAITDPKFISAVQNLGISLFQAFSNALPVIVEIINKVSRFFLELDARANDPQIRALDKKGDAGSVDEAAKRATEQMARGRYNLGKKGSFGMSMEDFFEPFNTPAVDPTQIKGTGVGAPSGFSEAQAEAASQMAKAYEDLTNNTNARIEALLVESQAIGMADVAAMSFKNTQDLLAEAEKAGIELTPARIQQIIEMSDRLTDAQLSLEGLQITLENQTPWDSMAKQVERLNTLLDRGKISADDYAIGIGKAAETMVSTYASGANDVLDNVQKLTDSLGLEGKKAFEVQKALGIARAVVSGGEAIVHSYNAGTAIGGPVTGAIFAGIAAAATAAQIASIASSSYNSKSTTTASTGGGTTTAAPVQQSQGITLNLRGKPSDKVELGDVGSMFEGLQEYLGGQGKQIVIRYSDGSV